ncbi:MAG TPA: PhzF family phenazine biosynthesis protein [Gammaproteobacteria bacterium]
MTLQIYQIDAFAEKPFEGNPAAIVPLDDWLPHETMQAIAAENNLSETAFFVQHNSGFYIRWFTPTSEVKLCGHATLASAFVLFELLGYERDTVYFDSLSGPLSVTRQDGRFVLDFPSQAPVKCETPDDLVKGLGQTPLACYKSEDLLAVFADEEQVANIRPNYDYLVKLEHRGVIITAPSLEQDFVARFFAPKYGIPEDPVTGSAYTQLTPYWSERMGKNSFTAKQISSRGGKLSCELKDDRVMIAGRAVKYMQGTIDV